ncbi:MAG: TetR family transcriptional regulator C-terminal domain-containing protein, partial [Myxococcota bacterium]
AICKGAEISKGSFYWHYDSKADVFIDLLETWARQVMDELYEQFEDSFKEPDYMQAITTALERELHRGRAIVPFWLEFTVQARRDPQVRDALAKFYRRARAAIAEILRPVVAHRITEAELQGVAATIFGGYIGLLVQEFTDPDRAHASQMVRSFMNGVRWQLGAEEEPPSPPSTPPTPNDLLSTPTPPQPTAVPKDPTPHPDRIPADELHGFLGRWPQEAHDKALELRQLVLDVAPEAQERIIRGWKVIAYDRSGLVAYIKPRHDAVHLGFYEGVHIPDPHQRLEGSGKYRRHLVIHLDTALEHPIIRELLHNAFAP